MIVVEKLRYVVEKRGNLFWQPTKEMRALGFQAKPLGPDGDEARAEAKRLGAAWDAAVAARHKVTGYPPGTLGAYWDRLRGSKEKPSAWWTKKSPRAREDYERAWPHIDTWSPEKGKPTLSRTLITGISTEMCESFYEYLDGRPARDSRPEIPAAVSPRVRWRTIKVFKILLEDAVVRLRLGYASPAKKLPNPQPAGRSSIWLGAEIEDLVAVAAIAGFEGMSLAIETAWETMFSPVDVRTLRPHQLKHDGRGFYIERTRSKTSKEAFAAISDDLGQALLAYVQRQNRAQADDTPIFRTRDFAVGTGRPPRAVAYKSKDIFAGDFRLVRGILYPEDQRQLLDIRRSANVEADAAGADKKTLGELLANGLADNKFLEETYTPPTVAKAREVAAQRVQGRALLAGEVIRRRDR